MVLAFELDARGPARARVPVHPHRRARSADGRARSPGARTRSSRRSSRPRRSRCSPREDVTIAGAGTPFHLAYLDAQRALPAGQRLFPSARAFVGGGSAKPPQLHYDVKAELGGVGIVSGYGLTECPILAMAQHPRLRRAARQHRGPRDARRRDQGREARRHRRGGRRGGRALREGPAALPRLPRLRRSTPRRSTPTASSSRATWACSTTTATSRSPDG